MKNKTEIPERYVIYSNEAGTSIGYQLAEFATKEELLEELDEILQQNWSVTVSKREARRA